MSRDFVSAAEDAWSRLRVGTGIDAHALKPGRRLVLAGVDIPSECGLVGHSDADVVAHAVTDALLGGAGLADIGEFFPSEDQSLAGADSMGLLRQVVEQISAQGCAIVSLDCVIVMEAPKLAPYREQMIQNLVRTLDVNQDRVTVRATTTDHLGFVGRREGAAAFATCLVMRSASSA